jgi:hypothetical protein|tara:strand:+ start:668 stop:1543 length:876 start_codon:yes stop_codon:yes gene_type:complete
MATNPYFTQGTTGEQDLQQSLVDEQIKMFGKNVYYIPRTLVKTDSVFGEDTMSKFEGAFEIEAYVEDNTGFRGDGDMFSKFGVQIADQATFVISRTRFTTAVDDNATLIVEGRPNEGDLVYFPMANKIFEIQFVEYEVPFFTLGKQYTWGLRCELFQYSDEDIDTGITEVDAVEVNYANAITVNVADGGSGDFVAEEIVTGGNSNVTATVKSWNSATRQLVVYNRSGIFSIPETLTGNTSSAAWTSATYNTLNNVNDESQANFVIETQADGIIDFTEGNPFGEFGNKGSSI